MIQIKKIFQFISTISLPIIFFVLIPMLMYLDPTFQFSWNQVDPISQLSESQKYALHFKAIFIIAAILALMRYYQVLKPRYLDIKLPHWNLFSLFYQIGCISLIFVGVFPRFSHPQHLIAVFGTLTGFGTSIIFLSIDLDEHIIGQTIKTKLLAFWGYLLNSIAMFNVFYFRYTTYRGLWQTFIVFSYFTWFFMEAYVFNRESSSWKLLNYEMLDQPKIYKVTYLMEFFGFLLLLNAYILKFGSTLIDFTCTPNDSRCDTSNILIMVFGAFSLFFYSLKQQFRFAIKDTISQQFH